MKAGLITMILGLVTAAAGVIVGLVPWRSYCGSFFSPTSPSNIFDSQICSQQVGQTGTAVAILLVGGLSLAAVGAIVAVARSGTK